MFNKKAISPVVATSLLLVVAVVSVVGFQSWYNTFSSNLFVSAEQDSGNLDTSGIEGIIGDTLYLKAGNNLTVESIRIDGNDCNINGTYSGTQGLDVSECLSQSTSATPEIVLVTDDKVLSKSVFLSENVDLGSVSSLDCSSIPFGEWIEVPGNPTLGTQDFCVMKYEAKATTASEVNLFDSANMYCGDGTYGGGNNCLTDGSVNVTSKAASKPLTRVYQTEARQLCANLGSGYSLITDAQWVTIARNAENEAINWADNTIGSTIASGGGLKRGNIGLDDNASYNAASDPADRSLDTNSSAMFTLSNGETIWDISGNVWEWTNDTFDTNAESNLSQNLSNWYEWTAISGYDYLESSNSLFNATHGVGRVYADVDDAFPSGTVHGFLRGGDWYGGARAGAFALYLDEAPSRSDAFFGFRCSYAP